MNEISYNHASNLHTKTGALIGMDKFLTVHKLTSLLDVGAGTGTWLAAALANGVTDVVGVDGVQADEALLCVPQSLIITHDLREPFRLGRRFDGAICLEVAEHLPESSAQTLIESICSHTDFVFFSGRPRTAR